MLCSISHAGLALRSPKELVPLQELTSSSHSISSFFTATDWEYHQSATRYFRNLLNIRESTVYKRILAPCLTVTAFSALVALYNSTHTLPSKALAAHASLSPPGMRQAVGA